MRPLPIVWQRLVSGGRDVRPLRRNPTRSRTRRAHPRTGAPAARPRTTPRDPRTRPGPRSSRTRPASNRIWIAGKPIEEWLEGTVGSSRCCSVCGDSECRTVEVRGTTFEAIPEQLILKAALLAASDAPRHSTGLESTSVSGDRQALIDRALPLRRRRTWRQSFINAPANRRGPRKASFAPGTGRGRRSRRATERRPRPGRRRCPRQWRCRARRRAGRRWRGRPG